jgi:hypothetical protein
MRFIIVPCCITHKSLAITDSSKAHRRTFVGELGGGGACVCVCVCVGGGGQVASGTRTVAAITRPSRSCRDLNHGRPSTTVAAIAPGPVPHMHPVTRRLRLP